MKSVNNQINESFKTTVADPKSAGKIQRYR